MPATAVIPAPKAYVKVVAVKKLVVGFLVCSHICPGGKTMGIHLWPTFGDLVRLPTYWQTRVSSSCEPVTITLKKLGCSRRALRMDTLAWHNEIGLRSYFVGLGMK